MEDHMRRESTLHGVLQADSSNLFDVSLGEDVTLNENVFDLTQDPDITITHAKPVKSTMVNFESIDLLGDATPLPLTAKSGPSFSLLNPTSSKNLFTTTTTEKHGTTSTESCDTELDVARLLIATERLRAERDDLRSQLDFLETETRIERRTIHAKLAHLESELRGLRQQSNSGDTNTQPKIEESPRRAQMGRTVGALSIALQHYSDICYTLGSTVSSGDVVDFTQWDQEREELQSQIKLLEADLKAVQENLQEVQQDYDGHLWACVKDATNSNSESIQSRIEELEGRVARRTERIGILQHDIRRLECNLNLAEEQITELSTELEGATVDKACLVDDCATARQERDVAREIIVSLELQVENLRAENATQIAELQFSLEERNSTTTRLDVLEKRCEELEAALQAKDIQLRDLSGMRDEELFQAQQDRDAAQETALSLEVRVEHLLQRCAAHEDDLKVTGQELLLANKTLESLKQRSSESTKANAEEIQSIRLRELSVQERIAELEKDKEKLHCDIAECFDQLEGSRRKCSLLHEQKRQAEDRVVVLQEEVTKLLDETAFHKNTLERWHFDKEQVEKSHQETLVALTEQLAIAIGQRRSVSFALGKARNTVEELQQESESLLDVAREQGLTIITIKQQIQVASSSLRAYEVIVLALCRELERAQSELLFTNDLVRSREGITSQIQSELDALRQQSKADSDSRVVDAEARVQEANAAANTAQTLADERQQFISSLEEQNIALRTQLSHQQYQLLEFEGAIRLAELNGKAEFFASQNCIEECEGLIRQLEASAKGLLSDLEAANEGNTELQSTVCTNMILQKEISELTRTVEEVREAKAVGVRALEERIDTLHGKLDEAEAALMQMKEQHNRELIERNDQIQFLQLQLDKSRKHLDEALSNLQDRDNSLQASECNFKGLLSRHSSLETKHQVTEGILKDMLHKAQLTAEERTKSLKELASLREEVLNLRKELSIASQQSNTARLEFDLQASRNDQEITNLKKSLSRYQNQRSFQERAEILEVRVEELEEMLQARCAEIEENDDRFLDVLKEKKKLNAKIESLNRKVYKLQKQLAEASEIPSGPLINTESSDPQTGPSLKQSLSPKFSPDDSSRRNVSSELIIPEVSEGNPMKENIQPSILERPQNKPRPIMRLVELHDTSPGTPISRKRPAPDDFDPVVPKVAQPVIATSPAAGLRKALSGIRSGFTPTRNPLSQSPLKKKSVPSLGISDITNSPRARPVTASSSAASRGRSWLGKIRGDSSDRDARPISQLFNPSSLERRAPYP